MNVKEIKGAREIKIKKYHCVYFLTDDKGEILYVGRSDISSLSRIGEHIRNGKKFKKVFTIETKDREESELMEARLILQIKPKYNLKIEKRQMLGLLNAVDIKEKTGISKGFIVMAAKEYGIKTETIHLTNYWGPEIIEAVKKYIKKNKTRYLRLSKFI